MPIKIKKGGVEKAKTTESVTEKKVTTVKEEETDVFSSLYDSEKGEASVRVGLGMTRNLGDFNSARFDVAITIPCNPDTVDDAYEAAVAWCDTRMSDIQSGFDD